MPACNKESDSNNEHNNFKKAYPFLKPEQQHEYQRVYRNGIQLRYMPYEQKDDNARAEYDGRADEYTYEYRGLSTSHEEERCYGENNEREDILRRFIVEEVAECFTDGCIGRVNNVKPSYISYPAWLRRHTAEDIRIPQHLMVCCFNKGLKRVRGN